MYRHTCICTSFWVTVDQKIFGTETKSTVKTEHKKKHAAPI